MNELRFINIDNITDEMVLAKNLYNEDTGQILLNSGCSLKKYVSRLKNLGYTYVYVNDSFSKNIHVPEIISEEVKINSKIALKKTLNGLSNKNIDLKLLQKTVDDIIDEILKNKELSISINEMRTKDDYIFSHSINVTSLAIIIGKKLNYSDDKLRKLGIGCFLHDIGKIQIPEEIFLKKTLLTREELGLVKQHPQLGFNMVKDSWDISPLSKSVILSHHERSDKSGYPRHIGENEIHEFAKIASIADTFDALSTDKPYRTKWPTYQIIEYIMSRSNIYFNSEIVNLFIKEISIFGNGTMVKLSDGRNAIIKEQNKDFPTRPIIIVITDEMGNQLNNSEEIDLLKVQSIIIKESM